MSAETVVCIGAGPSQLPYIQEIKERGYRLLCVDRNPESPGFSLADDHIVSSTFDYRETPRMIMEKQGSGVVTRSVIAPCTGPPFRTAHETRKLLKLESDSARKIDELMDKLKMRKLFNEIGVSAIDVYNELSELNEECFPLVRKPRFGGMGGRGVGVFFDISEYLRECSSLEIDDHYAYESLVRGREIAVDAIWDGHSIEFISTGWTLFHKSMDIIVGSTSQDDKDISINRIKEILLKIFKKTALGPEVINADIVLDSSGRLHVIEIEFVPADGISLCRESFAYDLVGNYVSTYVGNDIVHQPKRIVNSLMLYNVRGVMEDIMGKESSYTPVVPYTVSTKKGERVIDGYYVVSDNDSRGLIERLIKVMPEISLERYGDAR